MDPSNECTLITQNLTQHTHTPPRIGRSPLRNMNYASPLRKGSPAKLAEGSPLRSKNSETGNSEKGNGEKGDSDKKGDRGDTKQYAELVAKLHAVTADFAHLEQELGAKNDALSDYEQKMANLEKLLRRMEEERHKIADLYEREIAFYKESIDQLQHRNTRMSKQFELGQLQTQTVSDEFEERYAKLARSYKALQSNYELEQNSKALLIDQIEYLTKERDFLIQNATAQIPSVADLDNSILHSLHNSDSDSDGSVHGTHALSALVEDLGDDFDSSSPIKDASYQSDSSVHIAQGFLFPPAPPLLEKLNSAGDKLVSPPLPDPQAKSSKRQSLPAKLKLLPSPEEDDFVLSPLKLTMGANSSYFDADVSVKSVSSATKKRWSSSKPNHSRYNSHDIVPIKVEFELTDSQLRSTSAPDKDYLRKLASVEEDGGDDDRDRAFMKLSGFSEEPLKRYSLISNSSKRSSLMTDSNMLVGDVTKQEITKLKFELQLLKLHNEKLLSYIGFELQKQKKSIKKLSSKQNLLGGKMEYSDAKLIEKLRNMLIHKKRVLRSVSINPVLSKDASRHSSMFQPGVGIKAIHDEDEDFMFRSSFINSLERGEFDDCELQRYGEASQPLDSRHVKKHKSQNFRPSMEYEDLDASFVDDGMLLIDEEPDEDEWDTTSDNGSLLDVDYAQLNRFNQMKYLIMGKEHMKKRKKQADDSLVDENLKYKFLTIVIGIVIVGVRFTTHPPQQLRG